MSPFVPTAFLGDFGQALQLIVTKQESQTGGSEVGGSQLWDLLVHHVWLCLVAMVIACAVAIPLGLWLGHTGKGGFVAINLSNVGRAVPSLALIAFFVAFLGVGFVNVTLALVLLAIPPILTNAFTGVRQVDPEVVDSARGQGLTGLQIVRQIELPLALPLIMGGVRTSAVNVIATATLAPLAGVTSLGDPIISFGVYGEAGRLAGAILVALLAIACEIGLGAVQRAVTPRGLRLASST